MAMDADNMRKVLDIIDAYRGKIDKTFKIPLSEYRERHAKVWAELEARGIDLGFFFWYREMPGDGVYLTGYNPTIERASGVITPGKPPMLLVGPESGLLSREVGLDLETHFTTEFSIPDEFYEGVTCDSLSEVVRNYVGHDIKKIAYMTSYDLLPAKFYDVLCQDIDSRAEVIDATDILENLRYEKSENEMKCMMQADIIASAAIRAMLAVLQPGMQELEVAAVGDFVMKSLGGDGYGVETTVCSADRCRTVIGPATNKTIHEGEIVLLGASPSYECYKGVCRRSVVMGERSPLQKRYFEVMNKGFQLAMDELKNVVENDLPINRVDLAARNYFATQELDGYNMKACHMYSTCHGTGLTECLEIRVIHPEKPEHYGKNVGMMLDLAQFNHPNTEIAGGCVEDAFFKNGNKLLHWTDLPADVQHLVGKGL